MTIEKERDGNQVTIQPAGRIDALTAPELQDAINEELEGVALLNIDFKNVNHISSAGLRVLLSTQKVMDMQGELRIRNVNEAILEIFDTTGFTNILNIDE